jgi:hypothetical protein
MRSIFLTLITTGLLTAGIPARVAAGASQGIQAEDAGPSWTYSASAYFYFVPEERDYVQPTVTTDRRWLHLEARYNYEDLDTGSAWFGYNFNLGEEVSLAFTPKLGVVFGQTTGIAPGYNALLEWRKIALYSEGEHVFDNEVDEDSFFYSWSELTLSATDRMVAGLALQRTQVYETPNEFSWGMLIGVHFGSAAICGYVFDPDHEGRTYVVSASVEF